MSEQDEYVERLEEALVCASIVVATVQCVLKHHELLDLEFRYEDLPVATLGDICERALELIKPVNEEIGRRCEGEA